MVNLLVGKRFEEKFQVTSKNNLVGTVLVYLKTNFSEIQVTKQLPGGNHVYR